MGSRTKVVEELDYIDLDLLSHKFLMNHFDLGKEESKRSSSFLLDLQQLFPT